MQLTYHQKSTNFIKLTKKITIDVPPHNFTTNIWRLKSMKYGLDVSKHQGAINYDALTKAVFNIVRTGYGINKATQTDEYFHRNMQQSLEKGYAVGAYHASYAKNITDAITEADFACDLCEQYKANMSEPIFFDFEYFSSDYIKQVHGIETTPLLVQSLTEAFCNRVLERGFETGVYFNKDYFDRFYGEDFFNANTKYKRWYARPGYSKPDKPCDYWQYASNHGAEYGYNGNIDKNVAYVALHEFEHAEDIAPMKPLASYPVPLLIGYASTGDVKQIVAKLDSLLIPHKVENGFITTTIAVGLGDQCELLSLCSNLLIPCIIANNGEEPAEPESETEELEQLKKELVATKEKLAQTEQIAENSLVRMVNAEKLLTNFKEQITANENERK